MSQKQLRCSKIEENILRIGAVFMTKKEKRKYKEKDKGIVDFLMVQNHFLKDFKCWIEEMQDPRHQSYVTYRPSDFIYLGILKNICAIKSMRQMEEVFNEIVCADTLRILSGNVKTKEIPHYDTLNYYLERLSPECLSDLRKKMIVSLIRGKHFYGNRLLGKYWRVILDGTETVRFHERHCENCLKTQVITKEGKKEFCYSHKVLEAKLVLSEHLVVSIGSEFIENETENVKKQDCEINAGKRLMKRLKKEYPRLPICIQGDAMFAVEPVMKLCREQGWKYIFSHKDNQRIVAENYALLEEEDGKIYVKGIDKENGTGAFYNHMENLAQKTEEMNVYEYQCLKKIKEKEKKVNFRWLTNIEITRRNLEEMIKAGRGRWKIENEGFNNQKNGLYDICHLNSRNSKAMKNHYLLTQIADILMQLYIAWCPLVKQINQSKKNTSSRLLESFRRQTVTDEDVLYIERYTTIHLE